MQTPVSYDDIAERRFSPLASAPSNTLSPFEGDGDSATFLFADPPEEHFAPIIDLTHPRTFSSLNALIHRWKHLHIYRTQPDGSVHSLTFLMRRPPNAGYELARGWKVVGLNERIHTIEYIKRRYGASVAWARFHASSRQWTKSISARRAKLSQRSTMSLKPTSIGNLSTTMKERRLGSGTI